MTQVEIDEFIEQYREDYRFLLRCKLRRARIGLFFARLTALCVPELLAVVNEEDAAFPTGNVGS